MPRDAHKQLEPQSRGKYHCRYERTLEDNLSTAFEVQDDVEVSCSVVYAAYKTGWVFEFSLRMRTFGSTNEHKKSSSECIIHGRVGIAFRSREPTA